MRDEDSWLAGSPVSASDRRRSGLQGDGLQFLIANSNFRDGG